MKIFIISSFISLLSFSVFANSFDSAVVPDCKDLRGTVLPDTVDQLKVVMRSNTNRPQVMITGVISQILPEDHSGLPHQKFTLTVNGQITLMVVSNLDFGRIPLVVGSTLSVCGEYLKVGQGMIHWTHFDPHGGHADGFTIVDGKLYGDKEVPAIQ